MFPSVKKDRTSVNGLEQKRKMKFAIRNNFGTTGTRQAREMRAARRKPRVPIGRGATG